MIFEAKKEHLDQVEILDALYECETKEALEEVFEKYGITDGEDKASYLKATMSGGEGHLHCIGEPTGDEWYAMALQFFLHGDGSWRVFRKLEAAGLL